MFSIPRLPFREDKVFSILVLLVLTVPLVFSWQLYEKFETIKISFWLISLGSAIVIASLRNSLNRISWPVAVLAGSFLLFGLVSTIFSISPLNSWVGFFPRFTSGFLFYFLWIATLLLLLFSLDTLRLQFLFKVLFFDAVFVSVSFILQSFGIGYYEGVNQSFISRAPGLLGNPNFSAMFLAAALPFVFPLLINAKNFWAKVYYGLGSIAVFFAIINFSSRGAWLALGAGLFFGFLLVILLKFSKKIIGLFLLGALLALGIVVFVSGFARPGTLNNLLKFTDINIDYRLFAWDIATEAIVKHPWLGYGPGNMQIYFERFRGPNLSGQGIFDDVHNLPLQMAGTTGVPFALCFFVLCGLAFLEGYRKLKVNPRDFWAGACLVSLVIWLTSSGFNPVSTANYLLLALVLAGLFLTPKGIFTPKNAYLSGFFIRVLGLSLSVIGLLFLASELLFFQAQKDYMAFRFQRSLNLLEAAIRLNPTSQLYYLYATADKIILRSNNLDLEKDINKIIQLQPESSKSPVLAANLYYLMYVNTSDSKYLKTAITNINRTFSKDKYFAARYTHAAFYLAEDNQLDLAKEYVKTALTIDSKHLPSWLLLARIYQLQNRADQMRYSLNEANKLFPEDIGLKKLSESAKIEKNIEKIEIPALINFMQIEG